MASLINKPLTSVYSTKSDLFLKRNCFKPNFLNLKKPFVTSIVCKAVTTTPDSQVQALNIADDVTQVIHTHFPVCIIHYNIHLNLSLLIASACCYV